MASTIINTMVKLVSRMVNAKNRKRSKVTDRSFHLMSLVSSVSLMSLDCAVVGCFMGSVD